MKCVYKMTKHELLDECLRLRMVIQKLAAFDENSACDDVKVALKAHPDCKHAILYGSLIGKLKREVINFKEYKF